MKVWELLNEKDLVLGQKVLLTDICNDFNSISQAEFIYEGKHSKFGKGFLGFRSENRKEAHNFICPSSFGISVFISKTEEV